MFRLAAASLLIAGSAALSASAQVPPAPTMDSRLDQARSEAASAEIEQRRLEAAAQQARDDATRLRAERLAAAQAIAAAEARISAADAQATIVQAHLAAQRQRLAAEQAPASSLLAGLALMARRPPVLLLADSRSAEELVKLRLLIAATTPAIQAKTAALASELERGRRLEQAALAAREAMVESRDELARKRQDFAKLEARAIRLAGTRGSEALGAGDVAIARHEQLSTLQRKALSGAEAARLARQLAGLGPAPLPVRDGGQVASTAIEYRLPALARVTDGLGAVSDNGVRSRGVTLATRRGAALVAPASGTILFAGPFRDYDGVVIIDHGRGWKSVLVNAGSGLARGTKVRIGERIGIALGAVEVQLQQGGRSLSPALIAGSSAMLSNPPEDG
ncbi:MAG: peptidoglycan DD-metalloendopeptidase family protein [Pseudomonadota bacterium]|nr:peptidoglycan DD-metalloendopeptidase family protein [Pseudomonadota bacterium]